MYEQITSVFASQRAMERGIANVIERHSAPITKLTKKVCLHHQSKPYVALPQDQHDAEAFVLGNTRECVSCHAIFERGVR